MELQDSPLVEAVFDLAFVHDFGEYDPTLPGLFYSTIAEKFPHKKEIPNFKYDVLDSNNVEKQINATLSRFSDDSGNHIQLTKDYIVFNKVKPQVNWETLKSNILVNTEKFIKFNNQNSQVSFCSLKYVNVFEIELGKNLKDFFSISLPLPSGDDFSSIRYTNNSIEFFYKDSIARLDFRTISPNETHSRTLLEISVINSEGFEYTNDYIENWLEVSHKYICEIFYASVNLDKLNEVADV